MADTKLIGQNYTPNDLVAKVTGRARYAEDFRAEGMLFAKLLLSPMPHARVRNIDASAALAMPGVKAILTADDLPDLGPNVERALTDLGDLPWGVDVATGVESASNRKDPARIAAFIEAVRKAESSE